jgi:hypothetical protein
LHYEKFLKVPKPPERFVAMKRIIIVCVITIIVGAFLTLLTNQEPLFYGPTTLPSLRLWDIISLMSSFFFFILPLFFAIRYLSAPVAQQDLLAAIVILGMFYSLLMLIEIRLSPQLHNWVYGYHQHSFAQHVRDGFRPKVFLQHGIWVGFFMFMTVLASLGLWKTTHKPKWIFAACWLFFVLAISKNLAASIICVLCAMVFLLTGRRLQIAFSAAVALVVLLYPTFRQSNIVPVDRIVSIAAFVSESRAQSLQFRLINEDNLLVRASEKPFAGWGLYSREQTFNDLGLRTSTSEGLWIQTIGKSGWIGYIALFGILTSPLILLAYKRRHIEPPPETLALALIMVGNLIYVIPNSTLTPVGVLVFGSVVGYLRFRDATNSIEDGAFRDPRGSSRQSNASYTRFPNRRHRSKS